jgi:hypothetical protein
VSRGFSNAQRANLNEVSLEFARVYSLGDDRVSVLNEVSRFQIDTRFAQKESSLKSLFQDKQPLERSAFQKPLWGKVQQYPHLAVFLKKHLNIRSFESTKVTVYAYICDDRKPALNDMGNWFALLGD